MSDIIKAMNAEIRCFEENRSESDYASVADIIEHAISQAHSEGFEKGIEAAAGFAENKADDMTGRNTDDWEQGFYDGCKRCAVGARALKQEKTNDT